MLNNGNFIYSAEQIASRVKKNHDLDVSLKLVRKVFRSELDLRYRKMKRVAFQGNSERCLVLR